MKTLMIMKWDGVTPDQYEKLRKIVNWEGNHPKGAVFHVAGFQKNVIRVIDIWESEKDFQNFLQNRIIPKLAEAGIKGEPQVNMVPVHATFVPQEELLMA